jgi:hypothetical protein
MFDTTRGGNRFELIETVTLYGGCCRPVPLDHLVQLLMGSALDAATDRKPKFTNKEREKLHRQSSVLSGAVAELVKILTDHPLEHIREHRLATLFEALGSTTFIASYVVKNKTLDRLRAGAMVATTNKRVARKAENKRIIAEEMARRGCVGPIDKATAEDIGDGVDLQAGTIQKYERAIRKTD